MTPQFSVEALEHRALPAAPFQTLPILPFSDPGVLDHVAAVVARGEQLGRHEDVVLKAGDSNSAPFANIPPGKYNPGLSYLAPLGSPSYDPSASGLATRYGNLLGTLQVYRNGSDSLAWQTPAAAPGWSTVNVLDALNNQIAATGAGVTLVMIGTNDVIAGTSTAAFGQNLVQIVTPLLAAGVVPVLSTIPDLHYLGGAYHDAVMAFNQVIADVAGQYEVPLWNAWAALNQLPNQGLDRGGVHLTTSPNGGGNFEPVDLLFGQNVRNLETLQILDWVQRSAVHAPLQQVRPFAGWQSLPVTGGVYAVGREADFSPVVDVHDATTGGLVDRFLAFTPAFGGGVRVATGDVSGDGVTDVICATATHAGVLRVFSGADGSPLSRVTPFGPAYSGGLTVAAGDLNGDGVSEVVVGEASGGSRMVVYEYRDGSLTPTTSLQAFPQLTTSGVSVAVAKVRGVGEEVVAGSMSVAPTVKLFSPGGNVSAVIHPFRSAAGFGVTVTAADLNGDGYDELALAPSVGGPGRVRVIDPVTDVVMSLFQAEPPVDGNWGLRLGRVQSVSGGRDTLLVGNGPGSRTSVLAYHNLSGVAAYLPPELANRSFGLFVG